MKGPTRDRRLVLYTDLDGTLLDAETYSHEAAGPALEAIRSRGALLVLCSSKTRAEMEPIGRALGLRAPFIVENGGAIYLPREEFATLVPEAEPCGSWVRIALGTPRAQLLACLADLKQRLAVPVVGWSDLAPEAIARECGLSLEEAQRAMRREFDEPFRLESDDPQVLSQMATIVAEHGLRLMRGGRYFHLVGASDKGRAVRALTDILRRRFGAIFTVGLGDSENDAPMLAEVDLPVLVRRPSGEPDPAVLRLVPHARVTSGIGPAGWNEAVLAILAGDG
ncbi:MAG: HAD-IIB family hydrolase [Blastocatellia bacterium]|nr:HAD-IIB family hydrolase [Blastocatellia bacterium]MCS7157829.1 HAD-IIB family hydrolase [Blastocatellia bacterium]MCX7753341.1 HAD-IIB family hydrolase [Blastocatellia bacterium]MDW8168094.1 HAD-IIB family hydrolase [Acidobacteriota bacterium]MDW8257657.1 HAD-IIB family hydrolase [Acidobacteriota bacterium]